MVGGGARDADSCGMGGGLALLRMRLTDFSVSGGVFLFDWIHGLLMDVASSVVILSSIVIGAPASKEGTYHHFRIYGASDCCTFAAIRHPRCFTELARTAILAIGCSMYSMLRTGKRPIAEPGS